MTPMIAHDLKTKFETHENVEGAQTKRGESKHEKGPRALERHR